MESSSISVKALKKELTKVKDSALLIGFFKEKLSLNEEFKKLDMQFGGIISSCIKNNGFKAEKGEIKSVYTNKNIKNIVLVGLGEEKKYARNIWGLLSLELWAQEFLDRAPDFRRLMTDPAPASVLTGH